MNKKMKAALAGLAFVAGCEIGIAIQLVKMIHKYTIKEEASNVDAEFPEEALIDEALPDESTEQAEPVSEDITTEEAAPVAEDTTTEQTAPVAEDTTTEQAATVLEDATTEGGKEI
jgi:hypothetical protein